jgi:hypothetical protein
LLGAAPTLSHFFLVNCLRFAFDFVVSVFESVMGSSAVLSPALTMPGTDFGRYCGLRRQGGWYVARTSWRPGSNAAAAAAAATGIVRATGLRPRRISEQEARIVPVSPDDDRLILPPGAAAPKVFVFGCCRIQAAVVVFSWFAFSFRV